jgi:high affinity sulfate transporter 1
MSMLAATGAACESCVAIFFLLVRCCTDAVLRTFGPALRAGNGTPFALGEGATIETFSRRLHVLSWLPGYRRTLLRADVIAGLSLAAFAIPESIAYATLAGLPAVTGLYCYLVAGIAYALFGTSRQIAVGPTSAIALLVASSLMPLAGGDVARYAVLAAATATLVGCCCIVARLLQVGFLVNFISTVVLSGFRAGAALYIASTQLPKVFGVADGSGSFFERIGKLLMQLPHAHVPSVILGVGAIAALLFLAHRWPGRPTTIVVVGGILLLMHVDAIARLGIHIAGHIPNGLPVPSLAVLALPSTDLKTLIPVALACFTLAYVETIATARTLALAHGDPIDPDRELIALGAANLATGSFGGFPVSGGMSQSAVNDMAGARSPFALVVNSASIAIVLAFLAAFFSAIPDPLLGGIVVVAAVHLLHFDDIKKIWASSRHEFWVMAFAVIAVLTSGLLDGVIWAVAFSLMMVVARACRPEIAVLGELPGTTIYVNVAYNPTATIADGALAIRTFGPWYYFNAMYIRQQLLRLVDGSPVHLNVVVIDFSASPMLDVQSVGTLKAIEDDLQARGARLLLARLYDETTNKLLRTHDLHAHFESHQSVHDLVERYRAEQAAPAPALPAEGPGRPT